MLSLDCYVRESRWRPKVASPSPRGLSRCQGATQCSVLRQCLLSLGSTSGGEGRQRLVILHQLCRRNHLLDTTALIDYLAGRQAVLITANMGTILWMWAGLWSNPGEPPPTTSSTKANFTIYFWGIVSFIIVACHYKESFPLPLRGTKCRSNLTGACHASPSPYSRLRLIARTW